MKKKFIIRLDDISWDMNYENYAFVRDVLISNNVKPLIGVIPQNGDLKLKSKIGIKHLSVEEFWKEVRKLYLDYKWDIALHGYDHIYITKEGGLLQKNNQSEFAGLPYKDQYIKIKKGLEIFKENGLDAIAFMAPSHSFDDMTIRALKDNNLRCITDGYAAFPYYYQDVLFVPQIRSYPSLRGYGIETVCYHTNSMQEKDLQKFRDFVSENRDLIISFQDVVNTATRSYPFLWNILNPPVKFAVYVLGRYRKLKRKWRK